MKNDHEALNTTNLKADISYIHEGMGVGAAAEGLFQLEDKTNFILHNGMSTVEIGCGQMELTRKVMLDCEAHAYAIDIYIDPSRCGELRSACAEKNVVHLFHPYECDISHEELNYEESSMDAGFCTETIEHLSNPYFMVAQMKKWLKHDAPFVLAFPRPEDNLGYGGGKHAHIYPGFLLKEPFQHFMKQMYFKLVHYHENGSSGWYVYGNYKEEGVLDVFSMGSGNYEDDKMFVELDAWTPSWAKENKE